MAVIIISIERLEFTWSPMSEMTLLVGSMLLVANKGELMLMRCYDMVLENNEAKASTNATKTTESIILWKIVTPTFQHINCLSQVSSKVRTSGKEFLIDTNSYRNRYLKVVTTITKTYDHFLIALDNHFGGPLTFFF